MARKKSAPFLKMKKVFQKKNIPYFIGAGALLYFLFSNKETNAATSKGYKEEENEMDAQGVRATYPNATYKSFADKLESAMFDVGTDEDSIYNVFKKLKNNLDFAKLFNAFGTRNKYEFGINQGKWNLVQWLQAELSSGEQDNVNDILNAAGITYRI